MKKVTIHEAKTHLSQLIRSALSGEEVIIAKGNKPLVRLVVVDGALPQRRLGTARDRVIISDSFDAPLTEFEDDAS